MESTLGRRNDQQLCHYGALCWQSNESNEIAVLEAANWNSLDDYSVFGVASAIRGGAKLFAPILDYGNIT